MPDQTPAQKQAEFLEALAAHLRAHPDLAPVQSSPRGSLYVCQADASTLVDWFHSVQVSDLRVDLFDDYAAVHAYGFTIGGQRVLDLWGTVHGLEKLLVEGGIGDLNDGLRLTVSDVEYFAAHGTLPEAGGTDG